MYILINSTLTAKNKYALKKLRMLTILLVEDNLLNAKLIAVLFAQYGIKLQFAENGIQAIEKIKTTPTFVSVVFRFFFNRSYFTLLIATSSTKRLFRFTSYDTDCFVFLLQTLKSNVSSSISSVFSKNFMINLSPLMFSL